jgi:hypothetical protein
MGTGWVTPTGTRVPRRYTAQQAPVAQRGERINSTGCKSEDKHIRARFLRTGSDRRSSGEEGLGDSGRSQLLTEVGDGFGTPGDFISRFPAACVTFWGPLLENEPAVESWYGLVGAPRLKHSVLQTSNPKPIERHHCTSRRV